MRRTPSDHPLGPGRSPTGASPTEADLYWRERAASADLGATPAAACVALAVVLLLLL